MALFKQLELKPHGRTRKPGEGDYLGLQWTKFEGIRAAPHIFSSAKWTAETRSYFREKIDSGEWKLVDYDIQDNGKTTVVKILDVKTGEFDDREFIISSLRGAK